MSIKEFVSTPKEHILEAREMSKKIKSKSNKEQIEMLKEIKEHLVNLYEEDLKRIKDI
jgi:hypothetical protein